MQGLGDGQRLGRVDGGVVPCGCRQFCRRYLVIIAVMTTAATFMVFIFIMVVIRGLVLFAIFNAQPNSNADQYQQPDDGNSNQTGR